MPELIKRGWETGEEFTLVGEAILDPHIDLLKFSGMEIKARKDGDEVFLEGKTYAVGHRTAVNGPFRAQVTKVFPCKNSQRFIQEFDSLVDELFEDDSKVPPQNVDDKPVERDLWKSRIERGRLFGESLFGGSQI